MNRHDRARMEEWFELLELRIVVMAAEVSQIRGELEGLKTTLAAVRRTPKMSAEQILALWRTEAEKYDESIQKLMPEIFDNARAEQKRSRKTG